MNTKDRIDFARHQPLFVVVGTMLFALAGVTAFSNLSVEALPELTDHAGHRYRAGPGGLRHRLRRGHNAGGSCCFGFGGGIAVLITPPAHQCTATGREDASG